MERWIWDDKQRTSSSRIIVLLKDIEDLILKERPEDDFNDRCFSTWHNGWYLVIAERIKTLEFLYPIFNNINNSLQLKSKNTRYKEICLNI